MKIKSIISSILAAGLSVTFAQYAQLNRTNDGKPDPKATIQDYLQYARTKPKNPTDFADRALGVSAGSLISINFPQAIASYQNLGQM